MGYCTVRHLRVRHTGTVSSFTTDGSCICSHVCARSTLCMHLASESAEQRGAGAG